MPLTQRSKWQIIISKVMAHKPRKRFGQNFLHDPHIIDHILSNIDAHATQHWVEIGPGQGALTEPLLNLGVQLDVIELDRDLVKLLKSKFQQFKNINIHSHDALQFDFASLSRNTEKIHIIGNLPYNISTPLLFHLLDHTENIADMHFMLQKEVTDRICATPGSKKYGRLSVMIQFFCTTEHLFDVPASSFTPAPKVTSAMVKLTPHQSTPVNIHSFDHFKLVVNQAFSQRRKTLRNALRKLLTEEQIIESGIDAGLRAERISLEEFATLSNLLKDQVNL